MAIAVRGIMVGIHRSGIHALVGTILGIMTGAMIPGIMVGMTHGMPVDTGAGTDGMAGTEAGMVVGMTHGLDIIPVGEAWP